MTDAQRFPLMTDAGRAGLARLREHAHAPRFNFPCGDRLNLSGLQHVQAFAQRVAGNPHISLEECLECAGKWYKSVPFFRERGAFPGTWASLPTMGRDDIRRAPWALVPDDESLDDLLVYYTSGTTGSRMQVLSHPVTASSYLPLLERALQTVGVELGRGPETVAILNVCSQQRVLTHAAISSYLDQAGYVKINLNPTDWRTSADIAAYIDDLKPRIITSNPISLVEMARLPLTWKPQALVSTAMSLLPATRAYLERHFGCPVLDVYSMNECRFLAFRADAGPWQPGAPDTFIEILNPQGDPCAPGQVGEITITCPRNPFLPLLRYRTGDFAAFRTAAESASLSPREAEDGHLAPQKAAPSQSLSQSKPPHHEDHVAALRNQPSQYQLVDFHGRPPVLFELPDGRMINNIDVMGVLRRFPIFRFALHQNASGAFELRLEGGEEGEHELRQAFKEAFGVEVPLTILPFATATRGEKFFEFSSEKVIAPDRQKLVYL
jgi:phenylacetate-CoA ligase